MNFVLLDNVKFKSRKNRILLHKNMFVNVMHFDLSCWLMDQSNMVFHQYEFVIVCSEGVWAMSYGIKHYFPRKFMSIIYVVNVVCLILF